MNRRCRWLAGIVGFAAVAAHGQSSSGPAPVDRRDPSALQSFTADRKARQPGDVLTVLIVESAQASQSARTKAGKKDTVSASVRTDRVDFDGIDADVDTAFDGSGVIERSGRLLGRLAVSVDSVDAYGNLHVSGRQVIHVNNETQEMHVEGRVRPEDIGPDNTIVSWRVTDASISLVGKGFLSKKQSPGLVARLLNLFGV